MQIKRFVGVVVSGLVSSVVVGCGGPGSDCDATGFANIVFTTELEAGDQEGFSICATPTITSSTFEGSPTRSLLIDLSDADDTNLVSATVQWPAGEAPPSSFSGTSEVTINLVHGFEVANGVDDAGMTVSAFDDDAGTVSAEITFDAVIDDGSGVIRNYRAEPFFVKDASFTRSP